MRFDLTTRLGRAKAWLHATLVEHLAFNFFYRNFHRLSDEAFRSAQPTPGQIARTVRKHGIRTILNLKNRNPNSAQYLLEAEQCQALGVTLVDISIASRAFPEPEKLRLAKTLFEQVEYPIWIHCKAGSDRAGIYSTLYQHFRLGRPIAETDQLKFIPFGHFRHSNAGKFDFFLEQYLAYQKDHPDIGLIEWAETAADYPAIKRAFKSTGWSNFINDVVLRRE